MVSVGCLQSQPPVQGKRWVPPSEEPGGRLTVLSAECLCLATALIWPWSCGAELAPAEVAGQPALWDAAAKATGSLVLW